MWLRVKTGTSFLLVDRVLRTIDHQKPGGHIRDLRPRAHDDVVGTTGNVEFRWRLKKLKELFDNSRLLLLANDSYLRRAIHRPFDKSIHNFYSACFISIRRQASTIRGTGSLTFFKLIDDIRPT